MFLVHVNVCDFADTMLIVVQINLIWFDLIIPTICRDIAMIVQNVIDVRQH